MTMEIETAAIWPQANEPMISRNYQIRVMNKCSKIAGYKKIYKNQLSFCT
jgi:hypothetical protein